MKVFGDNKVLKRHIRDLHEEVNALPIQCDLCFKFFKNKNSLGSHKAKSHKANPLA